jgi:hypothetical protein
MEGSGFFHVTVNPEGAVAIYCKAALKQHWEQSEATLWSKAPSPLFTAHS